MLYHSEEIIHEEVKKVKVRRCVYSTVDLGKYCLLFQESCGILCQAGLTKTESAIIWYALANIRQDDGQVELDYKQVASVIKMSESGVRHALMTLAARNIILPSSMSPKCYKMQLTHVVNQRIAFQGKMTADRARQISNQMPLLSITRLCDNDLVDIETGELFSVKNDSDVVLKTDKLD